MTDHKAVMQQALRVLLRYGADEFDSGKPVVAALREAIVQPVPIAEPDDLTIAYMSGLADGKKAAQPERTAKPVAWQWFDTGTFRKTLPETAVVADWNPLFKNSAAIAQPVQLAEAKGKIIVTKNEAGAIVAVTRQDTHGRILEVIAEATIAQPARPLVNNLQIENLALANGFKLKEQPDGRMALSPYVFDFARAIESAHNIAQPKAQP